MAKFCTNCGKELNENQDICLGCGVLIAKEKNTIKYKEKGNHHGYIITTSIIMIVLGACMILGASDELYDYPLLVYSIPGLLGIVAGILILNSKKNRNLLWISGCVLFAGALINFIGIIDVSLYMILAIVFGILNFIYSQEK